MSAPVSSKVTGSPQGQLFVVATPIGNLADLSARAHETLASVHVVLAEDTRRTRILLNHLGVSKKIISLYEHNERERVSSVIERLNEGERVALVSDAGTPAISDPGAALVTQVRSAGYRVTPIPGPSALSAALSVAGFTTSSSDVLFVGFLPVKGKSRRALMDRIDAQPGLVVFFEAPHRIQQTLEELAMVSPNRQAVLCRELTKLHEEVISGNVNELAARATAGFRGEITVVLGPSLQNETAPDEQALRAALDRCLQAGLSRRDSAQAVAAICEVSRRAVYSLLPTNT